jgi:iron complex outermembrane recepter protein
MFKRKIIPVLITGLLSSGIAWTSTTQAEETTSNVGQIDVQGDDSYGSGQIVPEESSKARSEVNKSYLEKQAPTSSPYQSISMLPGVNASSQDATGLFGGNLSVRGFSSSQIGFTIDGAPVNDSGNFAVYPQEYVDIENLDQIFVTQGSTDTDAPHIGATGGNIGIVSANPTDYARVMAEQTAGDLRMYKTFVRLDTGLFSNGTTKAFLSFSQSGADKWRGGGNADRAHIDAKVITKIGTASQISFGLMYNNAVNNFFKNETLSDYNTKSYYYDYATTFPGRLAAVNGTAQNESTAVNGVSRADYYALQVNPFKNTLLTAKGNFQLNDSWRLDVEPYYWHGYGNGSFGTTLQEASGTGVTKVQDLNGDGDTLDKVLMYRSSITKTNRPGATVKLNWQNDMHKVAFGLWLERAEHIQTQPFSKVDANGNPLDIWGESYLALDGNGNVYQGRNQKTITTVTQPFVTDTISLANDKVKLMLGLRMPHTERDGTNYASAGTGLTSYFTASQTFNETLPSVGATYQLSQKQQLFANVTKNFRAPANYTLYESGNGQNLQPETAVNYDVGYRFQGDMLTSSATVFYTDFKNRQASSKDSTGSSITYNVGNVRDYGVELETGTRPVNGFSVYGSLTYTSSVMLSDFATYDASHNPVVLPTSGKTFVDTPTWLAGLGLSYAKNRFFADFKTRYTGMRYSSLMNDEQIPGFVTADVSMGYRFKDVSFMKNPLLRVNIANLFDKHYLNSIQSTQTNALAYGTLAGTSPTYLPGAPRFASITLSADFK